MQPAVSGYDDCSNRRTSGGTAPALVTAEAGMFERQLLTGMTFPAYQPRLLSDEGVIALTAKRAREIVGLALVERATTDGAELLSLFTPEGHRNRGVGTALMQAAADTCRRAGASAVTATFADDLPSAPAFRRVLMKSDWEPPVLENHIAEAPANRILELPAMSTTIIERIKTRLPPHLLVRWGETSAAQRDALRHRAASSSAIPDQLNPFLHPEAFDDEGAVLLIDGSIRGWLLCHRIDADKVRFTLGWVEPPFAGLGAYALLVRQAILWHLEDMNFSPRAHGSWTVAPEHPAMVRFLKRRLGPALTRLAEVHSARLPI